MKIATILMILCLGALFPSEELEAQDVYECVFLDAQSGERLDGVELIIYMPGKKGLKKFYANENGVIKFDIAPPLTKGHTYNISFSKDGYVSPSGYLRLMQPYSRKYQIHKLPADVPVANVIKSVEEQTVQNIEPITHVMSPDNIPVEEIPAPKLLDGFATNNFVFLIDVSNSMKEENRLGVLKESLVYLVEQFRNSDQVAVVAYSSAARVVLNSTKARQKDDIISAINNLKTLGATEGGVGLELAYEIAQKNFLNDGSNKIILATDGAFTSTKKELKQIKSMIKNEAGKEINLSVLSFGKIDDELVQNMKEMSSVGNGHYAHITSVKEGQSVLIREAQGKKLR